MGSGVSGGVPDGRLSTAGEAGSGRETTALVRVRGCRAGEVGMDDDAPRVALRGGLGLNGDMAVANEEAPSRGMSLARRTEGEGAAIGR